MATNTDSDKKEPQARRIATNARILDAALAVFLQNWFRTLSTRAGSGVAPALLSWSNLCTACEQRGSFPRSHGTAHSDAFEAMYCRVKAEPELGKRLGVMRQWLIDQVVDPSWLNAHAGIQAVCGTASGLTKNSGGKFDP